MAASSHRLEAARRCQMRGLAPKPMPRAEQFACRARGAADQQRAGAFARHEAVGVASRQQAVVALVVAKRRPAKAGCRWRPRQTRGDAALPISVRACASATATPTRPARPRPTARKRDTQFLLDPKEESGRPALNPPGAVGFGHAEQQRHAAHSSRECLAGIRRSPSPPSWPAWCRPRQGCSSGTWWAMIHSPPESMKRVSVGLLILARKAAQLCGAPSGPPRSRGRCAGWRCGLARLMPWLSCAGPSALPSAPSPTGIGNATCSRCCHHSLPFCPPGPARSRACSSSTAGPRANSCVRRSWSGSNTMVSSVAL